MPNMSLKKVDMPIQDPQIRRSNFDEVALGYTAEQAMEEAQRCLHCPTRPCVSGCPVSVNIPDFIEAVKDGEFEKAYHIIRETSSLPAVCGRVCPQETQCERECVRGKKGESVAIGRLERFVADWYRENVNEVPVKIVSNGHKVAVVGAGPAGLTCAGDLAKKGYHVSVFEALHVAGGVLMYGIPEFRLPKKVVRHEIDGLRKMGVDIQTNVVIGRSESVDDLFEQGYEAVFVGSGAGLPNFMGMPGENLKGVYSANEFLTRCNLMKAYRDGVDTPIQRAKRAVIVGGGNVAMDAARCAKRLGVEEVSIVYRRSMEELPARKEEVEHAMEEGINFQLLTNPVRVLGSDDGWVKGIECVKMELGEPDASGRRRPVEIAGSNFVMDIDCMIMAIGTSPNPLIRSTTEGLETNRKGCLITDENGLLASQSPDYAELLEPYDDLSKNEEVLNTQPAPAAPAGKVEVLDLPDDSPFASANTGKQDLAVNNNSPKEEILVAKKPAPEPKATEKHETKPAVKKSEQAAKPAAKGAYTVQVGVFSQESNAQNVVKKLNAAGISSRIEKVQVNGRSLNRVYAGSGNSRSALQNLLPQIEKLTGAKGKIVSVK